LRQRCSLLSVGRSNVEGLIPLTFATTSNVLWSRSDPLWKDRYPRLCPQSAETVQIGIDPFITEYIQAFRLMWHKSHTL
jgi:hypothetical protein